MKGITTAWLIVIFVIILVALLMTGFGRDLIDQLLLNLPCWC